MLNRPQPEPTLAETITSRYKRATWHVTVHEARDEMTEVAVLLAQYVRETWADGAPYGVTVEPGGPDVTVTVTPGAEGGDPRAFFITPDYWEDGNYVGVKVQPYPSTNSKGWAVITCAVADLDLFLPALTTAAFRP